MSTSLPENVPPLKNLRISQCSPALAARPATSFSRHQVQEQQTQAGCLATMLPIEVLLDVFKRLDLRSLGRSACVCQMWRSVASFDELWQYFCHEKLQQFQTISITVGRRVSALKNHYGQASKERLEFLHGTVQLLREYAQKQIASRYWEDSNDFWFAAHLLHSVVAQLLQTSQMLQYLESGKFSITVNFDIFELSLRRYYEEVKAMLPLEHLFSRAASLTYDAPNANEDPRLAVIADSEARAVWKQVVGSQCHCHFDDFYRLVIVNSLPQVKDAVRFRQHLHHFLNFPKDDLMTTYRFHVLVSLFGPLQDVTRNFEHYVLGEGFLGLVNMIKAEEVFRELMPSVNTVLIRFSRQRPTYLAFTSFNARERTIEHRRNADRAGNPIPIATFLKEQYPGYVLADIGVDDMVTRADNTFIYARSDDPYLTYTRR